jgi:hypothetical protein
MSVEEDASWCASREMTGGCKFILRRLVFVSTAAFPWDSTSVASLAGSFCGLFFEAKEAEGDGTRIVVPSAPASSLKKYFSQKGKLSEWSKIKRIFLSKLSRNSPV